jgi:hypothetical protein
VKKYRLLFFIPNSIKKYKEKNKQIKARIK